MPFDLAALRFGALRDPERLKRFIRFPAAPQLPEAWPAGNSRLLLGHNDTLGTCVPTAYCNAIERLRWSLGMQPVLTDDDCVSLYRDPGPYRGTPETDAGMDPVTLFEWGKQNAVGGFRLSEWHDIDPADEGDMRRAIEAQLSVMVVQEVRAPQAWQTIWTPAGGAVMGLHATSADRFVGPLTWAACWGVQQGIDQPWFSGPERQAVDIFALKFARA